MIPGVASEYTPIGGRTLPGLRVQSGQKQGTPFGTPRGASDSFAKNRKLEPRQAQPQIFYARVGFFRCQPLFSGLS